jgi:polynucleotide 5'-kinase involved in rRNA processing
VAKRDKEEREERARVAKRDREERSRVEREEERERVIRQKIEGGKEITIYVNAWQLTANWGTLN